MADFRLLEGGLGKRLLEGGAGFRMLEGPITGVPDPPTIGTATKGNAQISITFTPPAVVGDSPIIDYTATASTSESATGAGSPLVITGMVNGVAATVTVKARNTQGSSVASAASNSATPSTVPGAPTIGTATAGDTTVSVTFTAPASNGGDAITGYRITASIGGTTTGASSPIVDTGETNGVARTYTVAATNANGYGAESAASNSVTPAATYWTDAFTNFNNFRNITNTFAVVSGKAVPQNIGLCVAIWDQLNDHVAHGPDYSVSAAITKSTMVGAYNGLIGRYHKITDGNYYLALPRTSAGTDTLELYKVVEGVATALAASVNLEWVDGDTLTLEMVGNVIRVLVNATQQFSVVDGTFNNVSGQAGFRSLGDVTGGFDDFAVSGVGTSVIHHTSGAVTGTTAKIGFSLSAAGSVAVEYSTASNMSGSTTTAGTAVTSTTNYTGAITLTGLTADTTYYYRLLVDGVIKQFTPFAKTKTVASAAGVVKLAHVACGFFWDRYGDGSAFPIAEQAATFNHIATRAPDLFLFNGDVGYADSREGGGSTTLAHFRERQRHINTDWSRAHSLANLRRAVPSVFSWDNHEFGAGGLVYEALGGQAFQEYYSGINPTPYRSGVFYYVIRIRDVEIFVTDSRSYRSSYLATDDSAKTYLGLTQKQDLLDWLYTSTAAIKIVAVTQSVDPWSNSFTLTQAWGTGYTNERNQVWDFIQAQRVSGVFWINGDNHNHALFKTTRAGRNNYSATVGPVIQGNIALTVGEAAHADTLFSNDVKQQVFALLTITTTATPQIVLDVIDEANAVVNTATITRTTLDNALSAAAAPAVPTGVTAANAGSTSVLVTGPMPLNNGAAITLLTATSSPGGITGTVVPSSQIGTYSILVTGLTTGQAYTFTVTATNSVGTSAPSAASNSATPGAGGKIRLFLLRLLGF